MIVLKSHLHGSGDLSDPGTLGERGDFFDPGAIVNPASQTPEEVLMTDLLMSLLATLLAGLGWSEAAAEPNTGSSTDAHLGFDPNG